MQSRHFRRPATLVCEVERLGNAVAAAMSEASMLTRSAEVLARAEAAIHRARAISTEMRRLQGVADAQHQHMDELLESAAALPAAGSVEEIPQDNVDANPAHLRELAATRPDACNSAAAFPERYQQQKHEEGQAALAALRSRQLRLRICQLRAYHCLLSMHPQQSQHPQVGQAPGCCMYCMGYVCAHARPCITITSSHLFGLAGVAR